MASYLTYRNVLVSNSTVNASTLNAGTVQFSTLRVASTVISLGQSTSQTNNFSGGSFTAWASSLSTTASTAGAGLARVQRVTMSQSGQYQLAVQSSVSAYSVVKSSDSGVTWQTLTNGANGLPAGSPAYTSVSYSATGQYALAAVNPGGLYVSNNATAATPTFTTLTFTPYAYLPFDNSVTDVSGNSNPIATGSPAYVTGQVGNAINLANTMGSTATKYVRGTWSGSNNFTVSGRFNAQTVTAGQYGVIFSAIGAGITFYITNTGALFFFIGSSPTTGAGTAINYVTANTWYSFTIIYQLGSTSSLYLNGALVGSVTNTGPVTNAYTPSNQFCLGTADNALTNAFNGYIDDFRIYNYATIATNFSHTTVSATGQYMLAAAAGGGLFQSTNFGQTWTQVNAVLNGGVWTSLSQSESGQYALATTSAASIQPNLTGLAAATWSTNGVSWASSASSTYVGYQNYYLFNNSAANAWLSIASMYNTTSGAYSAATSTTILGGIGAIAGEWVQIQSSIPIVLQSYSYSDGGNVANIPKTYYIVGSNDGSNWYPLQYVVMSTNPFTSGTYVAASTYITLNASGSFTIQGTVTGQGVSTAYAYSTQSYTYFRMVITNIWGSNAGYCEFTEWAINFVGGLTCTSNYGQTWSNNNFLGTAQSFSAISGDGQYTLTGTGQTAYLIQNYLGLATQSYITVTLPSINANISGAACSNTGQYMVIVTQGTTNNVYYSSNYGSTWTALTVGSSPMTSCVMSVDGTYITVSNATNVYTLNWNGQGFTVAMGSAAGAVNQASNAIAIGNQAGQTNQTANSIVLNASGAAVNPYTQGFYVAPIQPAISSLARTFPLLGYGSDNQIVQSATSFSNSQQTVYGEWIQYQLATASPITSYQLQGRLSAAFRYPSSWIIVGSNDGTNWTLLDTQTGTSGWGTYTLTQAIAPYTYYRMVITQIPSAAAYYVDIGAFILNNGSPLFGASANYTVVASGLYNVLQLNSVTVCTTTFSWANTTAVNSLGIGADGQSGATFQTGWIPTTDGYTKGSVYFLGFNVTAFGSAYEYNASGIAFQGTSTTINTTILGNTNMAGTLCLMGGSRVGIGSTAPQYTLDVAGTAQINGTIPAYGQPDSAAVVPNSTFGQTWTQVTGLSASATWRGSAVSATGQYMTISINGASGTVWYSSNYGSTWTQAVAAAGLPINTNYPNLCMSGNGQYQLVGAVGGYIYVSSTYGTSWTQVGTIGSWGGCAVSYNGQYQFVYQSVAGGSIHYSTNYGATFTATSAPAAYWQGICCSASGQYVSACSASASNNTMWYSTNYGVTWTASSSTTGNWTGVSCSASGQYQTSCNGAIHYSNNYGANWTSSNAPTAGWQSTTCSASGQYQMASSASTSPYIYYSTNYGVTWTQSSSTNLGWVGISTSQNGLYTLAVATGGAVYLSTLANVGLLTNGRIGIGVTNPSSALHVVGSNSISTPAVFSFVNSGGGANVSGSDNVHSQITLGEYGPYIRAVQRNGVYTDGIRLDLCTNIGSNDPASVPRISILSGFYGGNVGIGTTNPGYLLTAQVVGWGIVQQQQASGPQVGFYTGSGSVYVGTITNHNLNFCTNNSGPQMTITTGTGAVSIPGALSKGSGTFDIEHPLYPNTQKRLVHSFIEGPRCDLIYRGTKTLVSGQAIIDINKECTYRPEDAMDHGTFEALCANSQMFLQNMSGFSRVTGSITAGTLTITCENSTSSDTISWMVVAERKDLFIKKWDRTDADGYLISQYIAEKQEAPPSNPQ